MISWRTMSGVLLFIRFVVFCANHLYIYTYNIRCIIITVGLFAIQSVKEMNKDLSETMFDRIAQCRYFNNFIFLPPKSGFYRCILKQHI